MAISLGKVFEPFIEQRPICVMARGVLEHLFNADQDRCVICTHCRGAVYACVAIFVCGGL